MGKPSGYALADLRERWRFYRQRNGNDYRITGSQSISKEKFTDKNGEGDRIRHQAMQDYQHEGSELEGEV